MISRTGSAWGGHRGRPRRPVRPGDRGHQERESGQDLTFRRSGKADDRAKALTEWKEWAAAQPTLKDWPAGKK
jgi:hypothetical protein